MACFASSYLPTSPSISGFCCSAYYHTHTHVPAKKVCAACVKEKISHSAASFFVSQIALSFLFTGFFLYCCWCCWCILFTAIKPNGSTSELHIIIVVVFQIKCETATLLTPASLIPAPSPSVDRHAWPRVVPGSHGLADKKLTTS